MSNNPQIDFQFRDIRGRKYRLQPIPFDAWITLSAEVGQVAGPMVGMIMEIQRLQSGQSNGVDIAPIMSEVAKAVLKHHNAGILDRILKWTCADMNHGKDGAPENWMPITGNVRDIWRGRYMDGILVLRWVLGVAFGDFIRELMSGELELSGLLEHVNP